MKKTIFALVALLSLTTFGFAQTLDSLPMPVAPGPMNDPVILDDTIVPVDTMLVDTAKSAKHVDPALAKFQRVSLGLRGGLAMTAGSKDIFSHLPGGQAALDIQYAPYWLCKNTYLGFLVGASVDYVATGVTMKNALDIYTTSTDNGDINYTIAANNIAETQQQLMVEIPLMFSLVDKCGVFFNIGPRFAIPVWTRSMVAFDQASILAYFPEEGVPVYNELVTGKAGSQVGLKEAKWNAPVLRITLGAEIGYEFALKNGDAFGLGLYGDCEVASFCKATDKAKSFIQITEPSNLSPASVAILSPTDVYANKLGMFDVGIKLTYHFNVSK